jgi:hypothetical protein
MDEPDEVSAELAKPGEPRIWGSSTAVFTERGLADCVNVVQSRELRVIASRQGRATNADAEVTSPPLP